MILSHGFRIIRGKAFPWLRASHDASPKRLLGYLSISKSGGRPWLAGLPLGRCPVGDDWKISTRAWIVKQENEKTFKKVISA